MTSDGGQEFVFVSQMSDQPASVVHNTWRILSSLIFLFWLLMWKHCYFNSCFSTVYDVKITMMEFSACSLLFGIQPNQFKIPLHLTLYFKLFSLTFRFWDLRKEKSILLEQVFGDLIHETNVAVTIIVLILAHYKFWMDAGFLLLTGFQQSKALHFQTSNFLVPCVDHLSWTKIYSEWTAFIKSSNN